MTLSDDVTARLVKAGLDPAQVEDMAARALEEDLAGGVDVFAYFRHEDAPTAPAYAARLLGLVRGDDA